MGDYTHKGKGNQSSTRKMLDCRCIQWILRISDVDRSSDKALYPMSLSSQIKKKKNCFASKSGHMHFCFISTHQVFSWKP